MLYDYDIFWSDLDPTKKVGIGADNPYQYPYLNLTKVYAGTKKVFVGTKILFSTIKCLSSSGKVISYY